jgi:glycine/sarcosine N-methyltransferase
MYETLSADYDRFVNWQNRLTTELPFIIERLKESGARQVLDAATGTGMHAIALAQNGYTSTGVDISPGMVEHARRNAQAAGLSIRFEVAGFGNLAATLGTGTFDALICLGNSLPHLLSRIDLDKTLVDFASCLKPGGLLLIQNRNFDAVIANHQRWMEPQSHSNNGEELIFQRFYDFDSDGLLTFNMVILKRQPEGNWTQKIISSRMRPLLKFELFLCLSEAGFTRLSAFGDMTGAHYDHDRSPNLVVVARKK